MLFRLVSKNGHNFSGAKLDCRQDCYEERGSDVGRGSDDNDSLKSKGDYDASDSESLDYKPSDSKPSDSKPSDSNYCCCSICRKGYV